ncbi:hypothetical protein, partial [Gallibacterium anatis]
RDGSVEYASAPRDIVATGINLPFVPGSLSIGIGNTNTTGDNSVGIPLWDMLMGNHTEAYYRDEEIIDFLYPKDPISLTENQKAKDIKVYQSKLWGQIGPKTKHINFNREVFFNNQEDKK